MAELEEVLAAYDWYDHPEGAKFVETHRDNHRTSGHWLYADGAGSIFHRVLDSAELWYIHQGSLLIHVLNPDGSLDTLRLGNDIAAGERPSHVVPTGLWQASELPPGTPWAFGTVVCAPPFNFGDNFQLAQPDTLLPNWPAHEQLIRRLTN